MQRKKIELVGRTDAGTRVNGEETPRRLERGRGESKSKKWEK